MLYQMILPSFIIVEELKTSQTNFGRTFNLHIALFCLGVKTFTLKQLNSSTLLFNGFWNLLSVIPHKVEPNPLVSFSIKLRCKAYNAAFGVKLTAQSCGWFPSRFQGNCYVIELNRTCSIYNIDCNLCLNIFENLYLKNYTWADRKSNKFK